MFTDIETQDKLFLFVYKYKNQEYINKTIKASSKREAYEKFKDYAVNRENDKEPGAYFKFYSFEPICDYYPITNIIEM